MKEQPVELIDQKTVLFVEYTQNGELASRLRELMNRLAPTLGFGVKVVERTGTALKNIFPLTNLWEGTGCSREDCITCLQGAEFTVPCTRKSVVYENI